MRSTIEEKPFDDSAYLSSEDIEILTHDKRVEEAEQAYKSQAYKSEWEAKEDLMNYMKYESNH